MADTEKKTIPFPFDPDVPETNTIHAQVTYPDVGQLVDADNGRVYTSSIGFPYANTYDVPNDWSCTPCPEKLPEYDNIRFGVDYLGDQEHPVSLDHYYSPSTNVIVEHTDSSVSLVFPIKKIILYASGSGTIDLYASDGGDTFSAIFSSTATAMLVPNGYDPLTDTGLAELPITLDSETEDGVLPVTYSGLVNNFEIDLDKYSVDTVSLSVTLTDDVVVRLAHQDDVTQNGIYQYANGVFTRLTSNVNAVNAVNPDPGEHVTYDESATDNVTVCIDGIGRKDHFRKDYSSRELHDYLYDHLGTQVSFGSGQTDNVGKFINWFTTSGKVDIGNGSGYSVYVNGFGLGEVYSGKPLTSESQQEVAEADDIYHPLLKWGIGTKRSARTETNVVALGRDWPFTQLSGNDAVIGDQITDDNHITLVRHADVDSTDPENPGVGNLEYEEPLANQPDGTEEPVNGKFYMNRHVMTIYTQYENNHGDFVIKPTFIHLPAPLDTKDGETIELTVSLVNDLSSIPDLRGSSDLVKKFLSCYYASISQPRVYVTSGSQKFSNKRLHITSISLGQEQQPQFTVVTDSAATRLKIGTKVRANIISDGDPSSFTALGVVTDKDSNSTTFRFDGEFPYDIKRNTWNTIKESFYICGIAFLDDVGESASENYTEPNNPTETSLGVAARTANVLKGDKGTGELGDLDELNKFFTLKNDVESRTTVGGTSTEDHRNVVATVYQTAVSTFPWAMNHRRRMNQLEYLLTDELVAGNNSLFCKIWNNNRKIIGLMDQKGFQLTDGYYSPEKSPVSYETEVSGNWYLADVLQVSLHDLNPEHNDEPHLVTDGNPVRQAQKLAAQYANDFRLSRLITSDNDVHAITIGFGNTANVLPPVGGHTNGSSQSSISYESGESLKAYLYRMSSLPEYVVGSSQYGPSEDEYTSSPELNNAHWLAIRDYFGEHGCNEEHESSGDIYEPNTVPVVPTVCRKYGLENSLLGAFKKLKTPQARQEYNELARLVELNSELVEATNDLESNSYQTNWYYPFVDISSPDGICPVHDKYVVSYSGLAEAQYPMASVDPVQMYRYELAETQTDPVNFISVPMPAKESKLLARFIEYFVAAYSAGMDNHFYRGVRVGLPGFEISDSNVASKAVYLKHIYRVDQSNQDNLHHDMAATSIGYYLDDMFADTASVVNSNADELNLDGVSVDAAEVPYRHRDWDGTDQDNPLKYTPTYTRVFMQFTFSERAGRWFTTDYRQTPTTYLSPLYGASALKEEAQSIYREDGSIALTELDNYNSTDQYRPLWRNSACVGFNNYRSAMYLPYSMYPAMDFTLGCVPYLYVDNQSVENLHVDWKERMDTEWPYDASGNLRDGWSNTTDVPRKPIKRLLRPYKPFNNYDDPENVGISLFPPADVNGGYNPDTDGGPHANFWSVRRFLRPAVTVLSNTDIPGVEDERYPQDSVRRAGEPSDPTLFRMFDFPKKNEVEYVLPDPHDPREDRAKPYMLYGQDKVVDNKHVTDYEGRLLMKPVYNNEGVYYVGYALGDDDQELSNVPEQDDQNGG